MKKETKNSLFLELAQPDENGFSRLVGVKEFVGQYKSLELGNGGSWCRKESTLAKIYIVEFDKTQTPGNRIDGIKLNGFNKNEIGSQSIRQDIIDEIKKKRCLVLDTGNPVPDHKNGRKDDLRAMNPKTQELSDFQPLSATANYAKRQHCKVCTETGNRYDAKKLGYPISVTQGTLKYEKPLGCIGCFWYDPLEFRSYLKEIDSKIIHKILKDIS